MAAARGGPEGLDAAATRAIRLAVEIGATLRDDLYVTFTTLLLALIYAEEDVSRRFRSALETASPGVVTRILSGKGESDLMARLPELASQVAAMTSLGWPTDRSLLSASAQNVLGEATAAAGSRPAGIGDLIAVYLAKPPSDHLRQLEGWGLSSSVRQAISKALAPADDTLVSEAQISSATSPASGDDISDLTRRTWPQGAAMTGYDRAASVVILIAGALTRPASSDEPHIQTATLIDAVVASQPFLAGRSLDVIGVLRAALRTGAGNAIESAQLDPAKLTPTASPGSPLTSGNVSEALDAAAAIARQTSKAPVDQPVPVGVRHLLAALLVAPDGAGRARTSRILDDRNADVVGLRRNLARVVVRLYPEDDPNKWNSLLVGSSATRIATLRPDTMPDDPRDADRLDLRRYADAIGALIAADKLVPPLSIAVFGPWGSGKSFFMKMIQAATAQFTKDGVVGPDSKRMFKKRVVPISFNAWNYADGNLWASLVYTILFKLQEELKQSATPGKHPFEVALETLNITKAAKVEAQGNLDKAIQKQDAAAAALGEAEKAATDKKEKEERVQAIDVIGEIRAMALEKLAPPDPNDAQAWIVKVGDSVRKAAEYLGRPELANQAPLLVNAAQDAAEATAALQQKAGAVEELLGEVHASVERGRSAVSWLANVKFERRDWVTMAGVVGLLLLLVVGLVTLLVNAWPVAAAIGQITAATVPLLGAIGVAIAWAKRHIGTANRAFNVLEALGERVRQAKARRLEEANAELAAARRGTNEAEAEVARRRADLEAANAAVKKANEDLTAATSPELMRRFVSQRLVDGEYERHLGLLHTVRKDMDRLGGILNDVHKLEAQYQTQPPIERIVLYIDDLDRCPPKQVVEVLEAVHLLLAIPLFIVVVGVDIRWVSQALIERYPKQLGAEDGIASPVDYLEKVFQVPFWLPPMDARQGRLLLRAELEAIPSEAADATQRKQQDGSGQAGGTGSQQAGAGGADTSRKEAEEKAADNPQQPAAATATTPAITATQAAEALTFTLKESNRLAEMAAAIGGSPRRAKRFVNLYRLMKASLSPDERIRFVTEDGAAGSYIAATILLAMTTGAPAAARPLIRRLADSTENEVGSFLAAGLAPLSVAPDDEGAAYAAAIGLINSFANQPAFASDMHQWAQRVDRFVFDNS